MKPKMLAKWRGFPSVLPASKKISRKMFLWFMIITISGSACQMGSTPSEPELFLVIQNVETKRAMFEKKIDERIILRYHWIHSVEHFEWTETFIVTNERELQLTESRFGEFGAGIPFNHEDSYRMEDGMMIMEPEHHILASIEWIHSHTALPRITMDDQTVIEGTDLPHHKPMKLFIEER